MVFQRVVRGKLRSDFQMVRGDRVAVKVDVVYIERVDGQVSQSMRVEGPEVMDREEMDADDV